MAISILKTLQGAIKRIVRASRQGWMIEHGLDIHFNAPWQDAGCYDVSYDVGVGQSRDGNRCWWYVGKVSNVNTGKLNSFLVGPFPNMQAALFAAQAWADGEVEHLVRLEMGVA